MIGNDQKRPIQSRKALMVTQISLPEELCSNRNRPSKAAQQNPEYKSVRVTSIPKRLVIQFYEGLMELQRELHKERCIHKNSLTKEPRQNWEYTDR
jgi:hypothetical protein